MSAAQASDPPEARVFMFAEDPHADIFCREFGGERMHPIRKRKGKNRRSGAKERQSALAINRRVRTFRFRTGLHGSALWSRHLLGGAMLSLRDPMSPKYVQK